MFPSGQRPCPGEPQHLKTYSSCCLRVRPPKMGLPRASCATRHLEESRRGAVNEEGGYTTATNRTIRTEDTDIDRGMGFATAAQYEHITYSQRAQQLYHTALLRNLECFVRPSGRMNIQRHPHLHPLRPNRIMPHTWQHVDNARRGMCEKECPRHDSTLACQLFSNQ